MGSTMDKRPEKMTEQDALLELQMQEKEKAKIFDFLTILTFLLVIGIFSILIFILPDKEFSEQENRVLAKRPAFATKSQSFAERLTDGVFTKEIASFYSDQFPLRDFFTGMKGLSEIVLLKKQNNDIIDGKDGYIIKREDYPDQDILQQNLQYLDQFALKQKEDEVTFYMAAAGRPVDFLKSYLPKGFPLDGIGKLWEKIDQTAGVSSFQYINLQRALMYQEVINIGEVVAEGKPQEQYYYKTDHHWTSLGAYYAYAEIMESLSLDPQPLEAFTIETATDAFFGTTWSSAGMKWVKPDKIEYFRYEGDDTDYRTIIEDDGSSYLGFYNRSYLEKKDKYGSFIGGERSANNARVDIVKEGEEGREKLLVIKDSFAHSIAPFLAYHYDLVIIDLRYYLEPVSALIREEGIKNVLVLNYAGTLTESVIYNKLY